LGGGHRCRSAVKKREGVFILNICTNRTQVFATIVYSIGGLLENRGQGTCPQENSFEVTSSRTLENTLLQNGM